MAHGEVGKVGVAIDSLADMEVLFQGIPLDKVSSSMTINAPAAVLLAFYIAAAEKQGVPASALKGTIQMISSRSTQPEVHTFSHRRPPCV